MTPIAPILDHIESQWLTLAKDAIARTTQSQSLHGVYVAAFWTFYVDYTEFFPPYLSINTEQSLEDPDNRWSPPAWDITLYDTTDALADNYQQLADDLSGQPNETWNQAIELHAQAIGRVCRHLTEHFRQQGSPGYTPDFVAGIFDEQEADEEYARLIQLSIEPHILPHLPDFPKLEKK